MNNLFNNNLSPYVSSDPYGGGPESCFLIYMKNTLTGHYELANGLYDPEDYQPTEEEAIDLAKKQRIYANDFDNTEVCVFECVNDPETGWTRNRLVFTYKRDPNSVASVIDIHMRALASAYPGLEHLTEALKRRDLW